MAAVIIYSSAVPVRRLMDLRSIESLKLVLLIINPTTILDTKTAPTRGKLFITGEIAMQILRIKIPITTTIPTIASWKARGSREEAFVTPFPMDVRSLGFTYPVRSDSGISLKDIFT